MQWRLGLDVGTNSLGWAALTIGNGADDRGKPLGRPEGLLDAGVRIFSDGRDPQSKESLAATRREPRGARRNRDRYLRRRSEFMARLIEHGLMPKDKAERKVLEKLDPWALRVRGLDERLRLHELGRALFHLQQRRGFKSNRKTDRGDKDKSAIRDATAKLQEAMKEKGARTLGEYLARERVTDPKKAATTQVRARPTVIKNKNTYDFYPTRAMIACEFDTLWAAQKQFHGHALTDAAYEALGDTDTGTLFFQRPLKPQPVGKCALDPKEQRAPKVLPSVQALRIYQEVNHLRVRKAGEAERKLSVEERNKIAAKLMSVGKLNFDSMRRLIKQPDVIFSHESDKRKHLDGDKTAAVMVQKPSAKAAGRWGPAWRELARTKQDAIVEILIGMEALKADKSANPAFGAVAQDIADALAMPLKRAKTLLSSTDEAVITQWLMDDCGFEQDRAEAIADAPLPDGHGNLGRTATAKVLRELMREDEAIDPKNDQPIAAPFTYDQAARLAGYEHSDFADGEVFDQLPYYGEVLERHVAFGSGNPGDIDEKRFGKLANPTVHVAMNQIRKVVNALAKRYGPPHEIAVELARDLPFSAQGKKDLDKQQKKNQDKNERIGKRLAELGETNTYKNRLKYRLWEELGDNVLRRECVYIGKRIGIEKLFTSEVEIDHILPRQRSMDDSFSNKVLCIREANRLKKQDTPFEAFGQDQHAPKYKWAEISQRAKALPGNKSWRFSPDAMERYDDEERGFLARQLGDTRYIARLAREYLTKMAGPDNVWVTTGRLTSDLRHAWGLNSVLAGHNRTESEAGEVKKNRNDHRHHALDAVVIALIDRALVQKVATAEGRADKEFLLNWTKNLSEPWDNFRDDVIRAMDAIVVSHKPDHGLAGKLHNATAYGVVNEPNAKGISQVVHRVPLSSMEKPSDLEAIRDPLIRENLINATSGLSGLSKTEFSHLIVLEGEKMNPPVRRVRILENMSVIPITDNDGRTYKAYKGDGNYCYDIYADSKGKWTGEVVSQFDANQKDFNPKSKFARNGQLLSMRLRKDDMVAIQNECCPLIMRVVKFSAGKITLANHREANVDARHRDKSDDFTYLTRAPSWLQQMQARLVYVDPAGRLHDPGPPS